MARVFHSELWGLRKQKYAWLTDHDHASTDWEEITPHEEFYLFVPRDEAALERYNGFPRVTEIMPVNSVGIVTSRDRFVIDFDRQALERRIRQFRDPNVPDELVRQAYGLSDKRKWALSEARRQVREDAEWQDKFTMCLYRPFDERHLFYHPAVIERGREELMRHMLGRDNRALVTPRRVERAGGWHHALPAVSPVEHVAVSAKTIDYVFPLYCYPDTSKDDLFSELEENAERRPNLHPDLIPALRHAYGFAPTPEDVFHYVYAVFYAPAYREKYAEFLKIDFPRVPFTSDPELFRVLAALGRRLTALHLLESDELTPPDAKFEGEGDGVVARTKAKGFRYEPEEERVYINRTQYFEPVPPEVWEYQVGGYQVCHKWLKDRRDRALSLEETLSYARIVTALARTIEAQEEVDALYPEAEREVVPLDI